MTARSSTTRRSPIGMPIRAIRAAAAVAMLAAVLAGCGGHDSKATQVAAKVNGDEISVHQINYVLQRVPGVTAENAPKARKEALERLIEQEVLVQAALDHKLDRDPQILQRLEAARREVLSRAWLERTAAAVAKPDSATVQKFYKENPGLFTGRRIYKFDEIVLGGRPPNWPELEQSLVKAKTVKEAAEMLRARGIDAPIATNATRPTEQLPIELLPKFSALTEGDVAIYPLGNAIVIGEIRSIQNAPVDEKTAGPVIEQFLMNKERNQAVRSEMKRLRDTAKVVYVGEFAGDAPKAGDVATTKGPENETGGKAAKSAGDASLEKGVKGLK